MRYEYDGLGRRVKKLTAGGDRQWIYDGDNLLYETSGDGLGLLAEYTYYGVDSPHSMRRSGGGTIYYYALSHAGSVSALFTGTAAANTYRYGPYGADQGGVETATNPLRFHARELDAETGLYYFRSRYYDPAVGRFISEDPLGLAGWINPYAFVGGDPVNRRDPFGLMGDCPEPTGPNDIIVCVPPLPSPIPSGLPFPNDGYIDEFGQATSLGPFGDQAAFADGKFVNMVPSNPACAAAKVNLAIGGGRGVALGVTNHVATYS